ERIKEASSVRLAGDRVVEIVEKPGEEEILSDIAGAPLYVFSPKAKPFISSVELSPRGEYEITGAIQSMIDAGLEVRGVLAEEWEHLSRWQDLLRLNFPYLREYL
ncbi:sugar phosphate nucleotidyltransferase, partial [Candidatus Pyrohabitans sp.]